MPFYLNAYCEAKKQDTLKIEDLDQVIYNTLMSVLKYETKYEVTSKAQLAQLSIKTENM